MPMVYCYECGKKLSSDAVCCPFCGAPNKQSKTSGASDKNALVALLLAILIGPLGIHRFYAGKTGSAIAMLIISLTIVGLIVTSIWALVDIITIAFGSFTDAKGKKLKFS
jgi:TM2 domain-containing membrane protein YozV